MNKTPTLSPEIEKEFDEDFVEIIDPESDHAHPSLVSPNPYPIKQFLAEKIEEAREEERGKCKQIYVDNVDWSEWGMSDQEAGESFDEAYEELTKEGQNETDQV